MPRIFLVSNTKSSDKEIINLNLSEIEFLEFNLNLAVFEVLVVTSKNSISALKFNDINIEKKIVVYAIGEPCAKAAKEVGFEQIYIAKNSHGNEFAYEIAPLIQGKKALFLRAQKTASRVGEILKEKECNVTQIIAYKNMCKRLGLEHKPESNSILIFTAPSAVNNFISNFGWDDSYKAVSIGKTTSSELIKFTNPITSEIQSVDSCIELAKTLL
ncbi:uroporphyrinogen-III synthase [Campylobacter sp. RM16187]|uniref:uroporphyrinogen-III synthase n=1 Tax=Campylobacter sp. RM16187 TaxID=1660063 RepID=UPI0021B63D68|nr:uroporphyrinogen-III synthase [Campylobacter sp. RM16187]QKG28874.1 uroporphyrinogen III synthase [Campylobacter sp. RM16187]